MSGLLRLLISIFICFAAGAVGSAITQPEIATWYAGLEKPFFSPPNWIFGPVWTLLYILMGVSFFLIWQEIGSLKKAPLVLIVFFTQLVLNSLWSIIFFGLKNPFFSFIEIVLLWGMILVNIFAFYKISKPAGLLLIPYLLWVSFAALLNLSIYRLNF